MCPRGRQQTPSARAARCRPGGARARCVRLLVACTKKRRTRRREKPAVCAAAATTRRLRPRVHSVKRAAAGRAVTVACWMAAASSKQAARKADTVEASLLQATPRFETRGVGSRVLRWARRKHQHHTNLDVFRAMLRLSPRHAEEGVQRGRGGQLRRRRQTGGRGQRLIPPVSGRTPRSTGKTLLFTILTPYLGLLGNLWAHSWPRQQIRSQ